MYAVLKAALQVGTDGSWGVRKLHTLFSKADKSFE